jgi:hypothetical protein
MGIVAPLIREKIKGIKPQHRKAVKQKAINVLVDHARTQKSLWAKLVKARAKLIDQAIHKNKGTNPFSNTIAERVAKIRPPR